MQADPEDDMPPVRLLAFHPDKAPTEMRPKTPHDVLKVRQRKMMRSLI
jgi:hypothetical protein